MFKAAILGIYLIFAVAAVHAAADSKQLVEILQLVDEKKYAEAIRGYENFLRTAPKSIQGPVQFEMATLHAALGDKDNALKLFEQAIGSGFDDCIAIAQYTEWKPMKSDPKFSALYGRVRISEADLKELYWLKAEIEHVTHDTKMMITENMNRMDTGFTAIPQSALPVRATSSPAVAFNRELLSIMHQVQRHFVMESDKGRIEHVTAMGIISGGASQAQILESARLADHAAQERQRAIQTRKFLLPAGAGTTPRTCAEWQ